MTDKSRPLVNAILHGIREKKGFDIAVMDLRHVPSSICDYFVICNGNSDTQTVAICDSVEHEVKKALKDRPLHIEGRQTGEWILLDYVNVVVHVFIPRIRDFYRLEELWADAPTENYPA
jgi:ribosome-associated protein